MVWLSKRPTQWKASDCLPAAAFDEYAVGYADRKAIVPPQYADLVRHVIFDPSIILNGKVVGTWKRTIKAKAVDLKFNPFGKLNLKADAAIRSALKRYKKFVM